MKAPSKIISKTAAANEQPIANAVIAPEKQVQIMPSYFDCVIQEY